jgi:hypothetical protein
MDDQRPKFELVQRIDSGLPQCPNREPEFRGWGRPGRRLQTIGDAKRELARVYRLAACGDIDVSDLSRAVYAIQALGKLAEAEIAELRIERLEAMLTDLEKGAGRGR